MSFNLIVVIPLNRPITIVVNENTTFATVLTTVFERLSLPPKQMGVEINGTHISNIDGSLKDYNCAYKNTRIDFYNL
jgi:hypothetical protein